MILNAGIQYNDMLGYPIPKRGIYYTARMILSQRGTIFKDQEYGKIKKVVSIWLCEDKLDALENEFQVSVSKEMSEEVQSMCNLSMGIYNKGYESGVSEGEMKKAKAMAYKLQGYGRSCEEIADIIEVDMDTVRSWLKEREG